MLRTSAVDVVSSCLTSSSLTSSSLMSSCLTTGVVYGSSLASRRDGLRSQSGDSRSMGKAESCGRRNTEQTKQLREKGEDCGNASDLKHEKM